MNTKTCRKCGKVKEASEFRRNARMKDGLSSWCSACHNAANRRSRLDRRVRALLEDAAQFEREADAAPNEARAHSLRSTAAAIRRDAELELLRAAA
jgi:uncharacterized protein YhaN